MGDAHKHYEIRCPIHGFISLNDWEKEIIDTPTFQRLRRIRQLAWTDLVYPGAMHTRFEHSLGVMHLATSLYDAICRSSRDVLKEEFGYDDHGLERDRKLVRLAALLHDIGHSPFSHASEELFPNREDGRQWKHEEYSAEIIRTKLKDVLENHPLNVNCGFTVDDVANLIEGGSRPGKTVVWRDLISGQMDADRMDYLLRDSYHSGVQYGKFDLNRIVNTIKAIPRGADQEASWLGLSQGGYHAAEGLMLARYFMFTQIYFHKTRMALDVHLKRALTHILPHGKFPDPIGSHLNDYLKWDDWRVLGALADGQGGEDGKRLRTRNHYRLIHQTPEIPSDEDLAFLSNAEEKLRACTIDFEEVKATKNWYKVGSTDIPIVSDLDPRKVEPLSSYSSVIKNLKPNKQVLLYVRPEDKDRSREILIGGKKNGGA